MKKKLRTLAAALIGTIIFSTSVAANSYEQANQAFKLDTRSYTMAPGNIYDFKVILKGNLTQKDVKISDSRTGSIVKMTPIKNTDKYRLTAVKEGVTYIVAEVGGSHLSFKVEVKQGVKQGGETAYSNYAVVPDSYRSVASGGSSGTTTARQSMYPNYARPYNVNAILKDMIAEGERFGMVYTDSFVITNINLNSGYGDSNASYWMPGDTLDYTIEPDEYDNSYWLRKNCLEAVESVYQTGVAYGAKGSDIRFKPVFISKGNGEYLFYVLYG
ncbi:hypothetical protein [Clostridium minihomine]|uniref:hypothetical protein n=1 Tax=Clostridium minihomine TaxID=2045012 RepID=UPI000C77DD7D|nr:hypothetical protein [Clostridium minihomine]